MRRLVRCIRRHWPTTRITLRADSHYGRPEVMDFCEQNDIDFVFGLSGNGTLDRAVEIIADDIRTRRALAQAPVLRGYAETMYRAKSPGRSRGAPVPASRPPRSASTSATHRPGRRFGRAHLRHPLLCARPGREPDQDAQGSARLRPHQLSLRRDGWQRFPPAISPYARTTQQPLVRDRIDRRLVQGAAVLKQRVEDDVAVERCAPRLSASKAP